MNIWKIKKAFEGLSKEKMEELKEVQREVCENKQIPIHELTLDYLLEDEIDEDEWQEIEYFLEYEAPAFYFSPEEKEKVKEMMAQDEYMAINDMMNSEDGSGEEIYPMWMIDEYFTNSSFHRFYKRVNREGKFNFYDHYFYFWLDEIRSTNNPVEVLDEDEICAYIEQLIDDEDYAKIPDSIIDYVEDELGFEI